MFARTLTFRIIFVLFVFMVLSLVITCFNDSRNDKNFEPSIDQIDNNLTSLVQGNVEYMQEGTIEVEFLPDASLILRLTDCERDNKAAFDELLNGYNEFFVTIDEIIKDCVAKNLDPRKFNPGVKSNLVDLYAMRQDLMTQRDHDLKALRQEIKEACYQPHEMIAQIYIDAAIAKYTKGVSLILPKYMTHIDARDILKGEIVGGKNSVAYKLRDDFLNGLGINNPNNDVYIIIKDPVKKTTEIFENATGIRL
ncbi:hypothetical protein [Flagellimonas lutimaris]|uniref:hypothetical protein n=1 Tax=Flagellimonas lutimaris TaxID=475082 RepID=UPI003F5CED69